MKGLLLDKDGDIRIVPHKGKDGLTGFVIGDTLIQNAATVLELNQGELKEDPVLGVNLIRYIRSPVSYTHLLAPEDDSNEEMPVIRTTGEKDINGRLRLSYKDLVDFATLAKTWNLPVTDALYMVLSPLHMGDLLLDKDASKYFYDRTFYLDPATGKPKGFMGIKFFENNDCPFYNAETAKKVAERCV